MQFGASALVRHIETLFRVLQCLLRKTTATVRNADIQVITLAIRIHI